MGSRIIKKGVLGGTFNPVHLGHLHLAQVAMQTLELDRLLFIPSYSPPHKTAGDLCSFKHRLAMLEIAVAAYPEFSVSSIEAEREGYTYTIDTLRHLFWDLEQDEELIFLMGFDAFQEMGTWKEYLRIPEYATIAVCERDGKDILGASERLFGEASFLVQKIKVPEKKISSSAVRRILVEDRQQAESVLPPDVFAYIEKYKLFT